MIVCNNVPTLTDQLPTIILNTVRAYIYVHTYTCTYVHACMCMYVRIYAHTYIHMYVWACVCILTCTIQYVFITYA